ncbi:hypothetical protein HEP73_02185 [Xanthomonas sp. GW]|uniref:DUF2793 domain-containing protein n=1 Tax=Xanthomonas sp. GW TaxID=2724121 RepID=UPI00163AD3D1|nr:DUF2793 domain-containing protein [Xanthomonas sp. GW]QNH21271.1 hypothetical protein HEP73_02185 [Xanthomonas sp. GW]
MSTPILPFEVWESGTNQNSIPANDNSLRWEILSGLVIADDVTVQPATPDNGDIYVIPAGATGSQWSTFDPLDLALYRSGTWYAYAPITGITVNISGVLYAFNGTAYEALGGGGGAPAAEDVSYDNTASGLAAEDVQAAIDEVATRNRSTTTTINHSASGALTINYNLGDYFIVNLAANVTGITISNPPATGQGGSIRIRFVQDGTGSRTVVLPSSAKAISGTDTSVQSAASAQTVLHLTTDNGGTSWAYSMKAVAA